MGNYNDEVMAYNIMNRLQEEATQKNDEAFLPLDDPYFTKIMELINVEKMNGKLTTSIKEIKSPTRNEIKMLVDLFYQIQHIRVALREQIRSIEGSDKDEKSKKGKSSKKAHIMILDYCLKSMMIIENAIKKALDIISDNSEVGRWLKQITGIGPVLAAGLIAYFDVTKSSYATGFISYAGFNDNNRPFIGKVGAEQIVNEVIGNNKTITDEMVAVIAERTQWKYMYIYDSAYDQKKGKWSKEKIIKTCAKIPYNKELKVLMYKVGDSFIKVSGKQKSVYGRIFAQKKAEITAENEAGKYAEQAAEYLTKKNYNKEKEAYKAYIVGKLPAGQVNARARRYANKIFLSHLFEEMYRVEYKKVPPRYYTIAKDPLHNRDIEPEVPYFSNVASPADK